MLTNLQLANFRSHENVALTFEPLTALVGPNGSGKSAILRAIDLVLGERWPSLASVRLPQDFTDFDATRELKIMASFDPPLVCEPDARKEQAKVHHLRVTCRPYKNTGKWGAAGDPNFDFDALDSLEGRPMVCTSLRKGAKPEFGPLLGVPSVVLDQARAVLIDHDRSIARQMPWTRGSVLQKLLAPARQEIDHALDAARGEKTRREAFNEGYASAMEALRSPHVKALEQTIDESTKRTLGFLGRSRMRDVSVKFGIADPTNPLNSFRLVYREGTNEIPAEETGLGVQSAIVVALFEAFRDSKQRVGIVLIDEPEMYLHPQAQRYFHGLLSDMAERRQAQVIYSTHSPVFAEAHRFESLRLLRREAGASTTVSWAKPADCADLAADRNKLLANYDVASGEALFADAVLLVEGSADLLAAKEVARQLPVDLDAENLSVIACGGKTAIPYHAGLCRALGIPICVLYDDDLRDEPAEDDDSAQARKDRAHNVRARRENEAIANAVPQAADRFVCTPSLESMLKVGEGKDRPARVLARIRESPDETPAAVTSAVVRLAGFVGADPVPF